VALCEASETRWDKLSPNPRSVLATIAQAVEFNIMSVIFELARRTDDFYITHFAHDGFCLDFTDNRRADRWIERITDAVNEKAEKLDICTELVMTRDPSRRSKGNDMSFSRLVQILA
jgi:hypothetical protein